VFGLLPIFLLPFSRPSGFLHLSVPGELPALTVSKGLPWATRSLLSALLAVAR